MTSLQNLFFTLTVNTALQKLNKIFYFLLKKSKTNCNKYWLCF